VPLSQVLIWRVLPVTVCGAQVFARAAQDLGQASVSSEVVEAVWGRIAPGQQPSVCTHSHSSGKGCLAMLWTQPMLT
jgi:hypothetical protein